MTSVKELLGRDDFAQFPIWMRMSLLAIVICVLAGIVMFGAWRLLVCPIVIIPFRSICEQLKRCYWSGFDPFIWKASDNARFKTVVFWNALTIFLDCMISAIVAVVGMFAVEGIASGLDVPFGLRLLVLFCGVFPLAGRYAKGIDLKTDPVIVLGGFALLPCALASLFLPLTTAHVALVLFAAALLLSVFRTRMTMPRIRRDYERLLKEVCMGFAHDYRQPRSWFPRPGVVFEPQFNSYRIMSVDAFDEIRPSLTILRVNVWGFFISIAMLVGGVAWVSCLGRGLLLFLVPFIMFYGGIMGSAACELDRKPSEMPSFFRGIFTVASICCMALPTIYFGGRDPSSLMAMGLLFSASLFFFPYFLVRKTSYGVCDTLEFLLASASVACTILARVNSCRWWECLLPAFFFGFLYSRVRRHFPRMDLPEAPPEPPAGPEVPADIQSRRARKRERQLAALRRSARH